MCKVPGYFACSISISFIFCILNVERAGWGETVTCWFLSGKQLLKQQWISPQRSISELLVCVICRKFTYSMWLDILLCELLQFINRSSYSASVCPAHCNFLVGVYAWLQRESSCLHFPPFRKPVPSWEVELRCHLQVGSCKNLIRFFFCSRVPRAHRWNREKGREMARLDKDAVWASVTLVFPHSRAQSWSMMNYEKGITSLHVQSAFHLQFGGTLYSLSSYSIRTMSGNSSHNASVPIFHWHIVLVLVPSYGLTAVLLTMSTHA